MKKLLIALLCLMLALPAQAEEPDRTALTEEWTRLLTYYESAHAAQSWALDYAQRYLVSCAWEDLMQARLAASSAYTVLLYTDVPAAALPSEQYALWMQQGHDLTYIPTEFSYLRQVHIEATAGAAYLMEMLQHGVFWQPHQNILQNWIAVQQETLATERAMVINMTNALLLSAPEALRNGEWAAYAAACPQLFAGAAWSADMPALEEAYAALLDRMENRIHDQSLVLGQGEIYTTLLLSLIEKADYAAIQQNAVPLTGLPHQISEPPWADPTVEYLWADEAGELWCAMPGESLEHHDISLRLVWYDVSRSAFDAYVKELLSSGMALVKDEAAPAQRMVYLRAGESLVALSWREAYTFLLSPDPAVCLTPVWFKEANPFG